MKNQGLGLSIKVLYLGLVILLLLLGIGILPIQAKEIILNYASWEFLESKAGPKLNKILDKFETLNPDIKINRIKIPFSQYTDKLITEFEAGEGPDVLSIQDYSLISIKDKGYLLPLNTIMDTKEFDEKFIEPFQSAKSGKNIFGIPFGSFCYAGLIYNKKLLKEAGVEIPKTPDELIEASNKVVEKTNALYGLIFMVNPAEPVYLAGGGLNRVIFGFGASVSDKDGNFTVNEPKFIEAVKFLKKIYDSPGTPSGVPIGEQRAAFNAGKAAFTIDGSYYMAIIESQNPELFKNDIMVAPLPFPTLGSMAETNFVGINANIPEDKKIAAVKFIEYWGQADVQREYAIPSFVLTGIKDTNTDLIKNIPWYKPYADALDYSVVPTITGHGSQTPEIRSLLADYISRALVGKLTVEEALQSLQIELEKNFK